ncbi:SPL family radical SAM protein [Longirhabdus pacifica]|uniref:SPL family radical SAM protein n=1 Tax=Longirhabdus pacifica TaxID=2305227 RepID=UPI00100894A9|nr:radical SAM protein [Longirhabdus pacifica]
MNKSANNAFTPKYAHIYIEKSAKSYDLTTHIMAQFPHATIIEIDNYKHVFSRPRQQFALQKEAAKLILAVKKPPFLYKGAEVCHDFGYKHFYYTSSTLNCVYNCDYCFLQGMFPSGHVVLFVNIEDYFNEVEAVLAQHPLYLSISYEADLLSFEHMVPFAKRWISFAESKRNIMMELRTKSANYKAISSIPAHDQVILAWTISPQEVITNHEPKTPTLKARLHSMKQAMEDGWKVRLCFDPVLHIEHFESLYRECIEQTFATINADQIEDISIGVFRIPKDYLKTMRKQRPDSALVHYPYIHQNGVMTYPDEITKKCIDNVYAAVAAHADKDKIFTE